MILPVIMAGGSGTRLWPQSRQGYPKQFLPLVNDTTMLQDTIQRLSGLPVSNPLLICGDDHRFIVAEQLRAIKQDPEAILLEPAGRNTAPAIASAALHAMTKTDSDPLLLVLAADHVIQNIPAFHEAVNLAAEQAETGKLVTFGIVPTGPETGYGYIRAAGDERVSSVAEFVEKPDLETAQKYLEQGGYSWNSGMFLFKASRYLEELKKFNPEIISACEKAVANSAADLDFVRLEQEAFLACPDDSIDYAVMEKTSDAMVVSMDAQWSDVGSWSALWDVLEKDTDNNVHKGDVISVGSQNNFVLGNGRLVATVGLEDTVVVETPDAVLVAAKDKVQDIKKVVAELKAQERSEASLHRQVYRPWGHYDSIDAGERYQVKRITVKPHEKLSVQMHHHRAEHWIVVSGTAKVTIGEKTFLVSENESTFIPIGEVHALENPGRIELEMIEVQSGSYLGEDDIVRFEDRYGRAEN
ncbi:MAG: mannose-1-phosphate guanylyltransferase/mannose-6-phosphate isomerase [Cellvibrionaceae bacterium]